MKPAAIVLLALIVAGYLLGAYAPAGCWGPRRTITWVFAKG